MKTASILLVILLQGCAVTTVADLGVTMATGKTTSSHILSQVHNQDCNTFNPLNGNEICNKVYYGQTYQKKLSKDLISKY